MTNDKKQVLGHVMACSTQIMGGATFVSTKVLLQYFLPAEVLFTRAVLAFLALMAIYPHRLKLRELKQELFFAGAGLFGIVMYFMLENTALTMTCFQRRYHCGLCALFCSGDGGIFLQK